MFVADSKRHQLLLLSLDEAIEVYAFQCKGKRFIGPHSLYFDTGGNLLFSDSGSGDSDGSIYSVDLNSEVSLLKEGLSRPSGLVMSEDAAGLFVGESQTNRIIYMEFDDEDNLGAIEVFAQFDEGSGIQSCFLTPKASSMPPARMWASPAWIQTAKPSKPSRCRATSPQG